MAEVSVGALGELKREEVVPAQLGVIWEPLRLDGRHDEGEVTDRHLGSGTVGEGSVGSGTGYRGGEVGEGEVVDRYLIPTRLGYSRLLSATLGYSRLLSGGRHPIHPSLGESGLISPEASRIG